METLININPPHSFKVACILLSVDPQELFQHLADHIVLPTAHILPDKKCIAATEYFIHYVSLKGNMQSYNAVQIKFMQEMEQTRKIICENIADRGSKTIEKKLKQFYSDWINKWDKLNSDAHNR